ncbi:unnamed protein product [Chrysoparadoxa australica]
MPTSARERDLRQELNRFCDSLKDSFATLLKAAQITDEQRVELEGFQLNVAATNMGVAAEGLLRLIQELKLSVVLQDSDAMDAEVEGRRSSLMAMQEELIDQASSLSLRLQKAESEMLLQGATP